jgi:hypothetical protein
MAKKEYMIFFDDLSRSIVKSDNILHALQGIPVEKVIRVSLYEKDKVVISNQVVDEAFDDHGEYRPPTTT